MYCKSLDIECSVFCPLYRLEMGGCAVTNPTPDQISEAFAPLINEVAELFTSLGHALTEAWRTLKPILEQIHEMPEVREYMTMREGERGDAA